jgi:hypothetical protein
MLFAIQSNTSSSWAEGDYRRSPHPKAINTLRLLNFSGGIEPGPDELTTIGL